MSVAEIDKRSNRLGVVRTMPTKIHAIAKARASEFDLGGFVRHVAHEIANPLNAIMMNAEMAKSLVDRGEIPRAAEALTRLRQRLRALRKTDARHAELRRRRRNARACGHVGAGTHRRIDLEYRLRIQRRACRRLRSMRRSLHLTGDRAALERAVVALLRNAAEAGASDVHISARDDAGDAVIDVRDNGTGLDAKGIERVSTSFHSTKRAAGGLGLGPHTHPRTRAKTRRIRHDSCEFTERAACRAAFARRALLKRIWHNVCYVPMRARRGQSGNSYAKPRSHRTSAQPDSLCRQWKRFTR